MNRYQKSSLKFFGIFCIALVGTVLYSHILNAPFVFDDYSSIVDNDTIKNFKFSLNDFSNNRHLTYLTFAINYAIGGLKTFGYHLMNNVIHVTNAILVYYFVILTFGTPFFELRNVECGIRNPKSEIRNFRIAHSPFFIAFSAAFIFVSHPIQSQAVTYITQRATSMAAAFYLFSLVMYIKWRLITEQRINGAAAQQVDKKNYRAIALLLYCASVLSAILAMKTKEIAFTLPVTIFLYEFSFFNKTPNAECRTPNLKRFFYLLPILFTLLVIPLSMLNFKAPVEIVTHDIDIQSRETINITRTDYLLTQFRVIVTYLRLLVLPINQSLDYTYPVYRSLFDVNVFLSFIFLLLMFVVAVYLFYSSRKTPHTKRLIAFGIFWFFITLSVESSIIPIKDVIVEHRLYLPSIGFFMASILSIEYFVKQRNVKIVAVIIIVAVLSIATFNRNSLWNNPQALWEDVLVKFPDNVKAHNALGVILKEREEYEKALIRFEKVLRINQGYFPAYYNIGDIQYKLGYYRSAIAYFTKVLKLRPSHQFHLDTMNSLAITYSDMGDNDNAAKTFSEAIRLFPSSVMLYNNLGRQYIKIGNFDFAIEILKKGLEIREEPHLRSNLSIAYTAKERANKNAGR